MALQSSEYNKLHIQVSRYKFYYIEKFVNYFSNKGTL